MPWAMRAPVETTAWTMPVSIIFEMIRPILAIVIAPDSVNTTLQSGSLTIATVTSSASPSDRPQQAGERLHLVQIEALECDEPVFLAVVELARVVHPRIVVALRIDGNQQRAESLVSVRATQGARRTESP